LITYEGVKYLDVHKVKTIHSFDKIFNVSGSIFIKTAVSSM